MGTPPTPPLTRTELRRASRALLVPEWQEAGAQARLKAARVLVVGAGGLGNPVIAALAGAGVGALTVADSDTVALSNLHRQPLFTTADVGRPKAEVAAARAQAINPFVRVRAAPHLTADNLGALLAEATLLIDATDNFETRYLIADTCTAAGREWVWGAASGTSGLVSVFGPGLGLRDVFPDPGDVASCDEAGVLGPVPGVVGQMMALEALKVLGGVGEALRGRLWTLDALTGHTRTLKLGSVRAPGPPAAT
ncbi:HesA/MoeB/ThiF family protein [Deinococcus sp. HMF7604]|uniref:HesA/MoeB/ThiF family protein n=1 Tax=Deinococcus betulae TaxID=2873312 RepID=UPI001CCFCF32|nr:HesA/MoeB/ThiF family protein [Deinococcus betulae]MBZ9752565.1 HesA/MoeB/ThiF family protein [Deinococcus betulae]